MFKKQFLLVSVLMIMALSLIFVRPANTALETQLLVDVSPSSDNVPYTQTQWYGFTATGGKGYCAILTPSTGNSDLYLFDTGFNLRKYSKNTGTTVDKVWYGQSTTGPMHIACYGAYNPSTNFTIQVITAPYVSTISPTSGATGTLVTISGFGFGATRGTSYVKFGTVQATSYYSWTNTQIKVYVPSGVVGGTIQVIVYVASKASNPMNFTAAGVSSDGTMWRYDLARTGNYPNGPTSLPLSVKWKYTHSGWIHPFNGGPNQQVPVFAGNWLYLPEDHSLHVLDANTGSLKYTFYRQTDFPNTPAIANGVVYFGISNMVFAYTTAADGTLSLKWSKEILPPSQEPYAYYYFSSPVVYNGVVYFTACEGRNGRVYALDANTGNIKWFYALPLEEAELSSPAIANSIVYLRSNKKVYAVDANTGVLKWSFTRPEGYSPTRGHLVVSNGVVYDAGWTTIYALNATTGSLSWGYTLALEEGEYFAGILTGCAIDNKGILYFISASNLWYKVRALDTTTRTLKWSYAFPTQDYVSTLPVVSNGVVYVGQLYTLYALDGVTGVLKWSYYFNGGVVEPTIGNGKLYVTYWSDQGEVYCFGQ